MEDRNLLDRIMNSDTVKFAGLGFLGVAGITGYAGTGIELIDPSFYGSSESTELIGAMTDTLENYSVYGGAAGTTLGLISDTKKKFYLGE